MQDILSRGKTAVIAGGTGLYVDSLIAGRTFAPVPQTGKREALEAQLRQEGGEAMLRKLRAVDPDAAARLHPADEKRIIRALEVYAETGRTITQHNLDTQQIPPRYRPVWIGLDYLDRAVLYRRIDLRVDLMLQAGLLDEIRALLARGVSPRTTAMQAIGYKEFFDALEGRSTLSAAADLCKQRSRNYAKRQLTWFRRNPQLCWLRMTGQEDFCTDPGRCPTEYSFFRALNMLRYGYRLQKRRSRYPCRKPQKIIRTSFLNQARRERTMLTVFLMNGFQMRGVITGFDQFVILLQSDGRQQMIYKHAVSTMTPAVPVHLTQN